jgi:ATP-dependent Clp protease adaptor protein ClpS
MDFVVEVLVTIFHKNNMEATELMLQVHRNGFGICGVYTYDIAQTKAGQVHALARQREFPLKCTVEEA